LASGKFVIVWQSNTAPVSSTGQRYSLDGARLGHPFKLNNGGPATNPSVAGLNLGGFVAVWNSGAQIYGDNGHPFDQINFANRSSPRVAPILSRGFVIVWAANGQIYGQRYARHGKLVGTEFVVSVGDENSLPAVAELSGGGFAVVWTQTDSWGLYTIFGRVYDARGRATGAVFRVDTPADHTYPVGRPSIAALTSSGQYVVTWPAYNEEALIGLIRGQRFGP
jgi:hypothetical protein